MHLFSFLKIYILKIELPRHSHSHSLFRTHFLGKSFLKQNILFKTLKTNKKKKKWKDFSSFLKLVTAKWLPFTVVCFNGNNKPNWNRIEFSNFLKPELNMAVVDDSDNSVGAFSFFFIKNFFQFFVKKFLVRKRFFFPQCQ